MPLADDASSNGSISGSDVEDLRDTMLGPTSPVTQPRPAPWQTTGLPGPSSQPVPARQGTADIQLQSPISPSKRKDTLQLSTASRSALMTGPNARFKLMVQKVMRMNQLRRLSDDEPGVNVASDTSQAVYGRIREQCSIEVIDYGPTKCKSTKLTNEQLADHIAHESQTRPLWAKVRWINIGGISFDVIKCLALRYKIHPLAIEDMLHGRQTYTSKADYYSKHIFLRLLCHTLKEDDDPEPNIKLQTSPGSASCKGPAFATPPPTYASRAPSELQLPSRDTKDDLDYGSTGNFPAFLRRRTGTATTQGGTQSRVRTLASTSLSGAQPWVGGSKGLGEDVESAWAKSVYPDLGRSQKSSAMSRYSFPLSSVFETSAEQAKRNSTQAAVNALKKGERVEVKLRNLYIIMYRDGTLISIHQDAVNDFFHPITTRVRQRDTLLRNSADVSLLLQAMIDLVVDNAVKVVDRYHTQILKFERDILVKPKMRTIKALHVTSGDLTMHKRTLGPLKTLIVGLRRYDLDRCIAQANSADPGFDEKKIQGYMSHKSKVYLADVMDHCEYILASLEMFETITENLIAYTFNIVSYDMNTTMRTLTVATVTFLPLTLLTGYFGMNFNGMPSVKAHSERFFWTLATPVIGVAILVFSLPSIIAAIRWMKKRYLVNNIEAHY